MHRLRGRPVTYYVPDRSGGSGSKVVVRAVLGGAGYAAVALPRLRELLQLGKGGCDECWCVGADVAGEEVVRVVATVSNGFEGEEAGGVGVAEAKLPEDGGDSALSSCGGAGKVLGCLVDG